MILKLTLVEMSGDLCKSLHVTLVPLLMMLVTMKEWFVLTLQATAVYHLIQDQLLHQEIDHVYTELKTVYSLSLKFSLLLVVELVLKPKRSVLVFFASSKEETK